MQGRMLALAFLQATLNTACDVALANNIECRG